ncbi:MAG: DUF2461 domain-containing protein [Chloroflexota bacterium]
MINPDLLQFFNTLAENNNKEWFNERKPHYKKLHDEFTEWFRQVAMEIARFDPDVRDYLNVPATVKVHRIYKDTRFSKGGDPLKTDISGVIGAGQNAPIYYLRISPNASILAGGYYTPDKDMLAAIRQEVAENHDDLRGLLADDRFKASFPNGLETSSALKTAPRGFAKDHPAVDLLRLKNYVAFRSLSDKEVLAPTFQDDLVEMYAAQYDVSRFFAGARRHLTKS